MKDLENYGVQEMNIEDIRETQGGWLRLLASVAFWHWDNWDDIKAGFESAQ